MEQEIDKIILRNNKPNFILKDGTELRMLQRGKEIIGWFSEEGYKELLKQEQRLEYQKWIDEQLANQEKRSTWELIKEGLKGTPIFGIEEIFRKEEENKEQWIINLLSIELERNKQEMIDSIQSIVNQKKYSLEKRYDLTDKNIIKVLNNMLDEKPKEKLNINILMNNKDYKKLYEALLILGYKPYTLSEKKFMGYDIIISDIEEGTIIIKEI